MSRGITLIVLILLVRLVRSLTSAHSECQFELLGYNLTNISQIAIFKKMLNCSMLSNKKLERGALINLVSADSSRL